jgi:hypothetical protein
VTEYEYVMARDNIYGRWRGPYRARIKDDRLLWGFGGMSGMPLPDEGEFEIVKSYGWLDEDEDWEKIDDIEQQSRKEFPPRDAIEDSAGWLAPDGKFYPCGWMEHTSLQYDLWLSFDLEHTKLENQGWARVDARHIFWGSWEALLKEPLTQQQLVTLLKLWEMPGHYLDKGVIAEVLDRHGWKVK